MFYVAHRLRNCSTQNSSEFLSFAFLFTDFRGIFGAHTFGKLAPFFFFFYSTTVKDFISRVNRVTIYPKQFSVSTSAADLHSGNGLHDNEISAYSEKDFIKDIKVNNSIHFFSLSRFSITNSLVSVSLIYTNIIWILFSFLFFIK